MKRMLLGIVALATLIAAECQASAAPVVFNVDCLFVYPRGGDELFLGGTITIDTATGEAVSADLDVGVAWNVSTSVVTGSVSTPKGRQKKVQNVEYFQIEAVGLDISANEYVSVYLVFPTSSLVGYEGGPLVPEVPGVNTPFTFIAFGITEVFWLYDGTLEPQ
jgi:hypothetical protein